MSTTSPYGAPVAVANLPPGANEPIPLAEPTWRAFLGTLRQRRPIVRLLETLPDGKVVRMWGGDRPLIFVGAGPTGSAIADRAEAELPWVEVRRG